MKVYFRDGHIPEALAWTMIVLIPKSGGRYRGIGLVKVFWKVFALIVNNRLRSTIILHDALHSFIRVRGTGTVIMDAKI